jgi:hypothetical protein
MNNEEHSQHTDTCRRPVTRVRITDNGYDSLIAIITDFTDISVFLPVIPNHDTDFKRKRILNEIDLMQSYLMMIIFRIYFTV